MTAPATVADAVDRFDAAVGQADRDAAVAVVTGLLADGLDPVTVMLQVIAPVQRRVGERWQRGEWAVAQEHAATSVSAAALEAVAGAAAATPADRGHAVVACAEGEWHALPATIIATGLRAAGWKVTPLGASTPVARLARYLQDLGPSVTAVSCSVAAGLPNARDFVRASTTAGIPVLAGGAAFGPDDRRATAIGATAWAPDVRTAVDAVAALPLVVPAAEPLPAERTGEETALRAARRPLTDAVLLRCRSGLTLPPEPEEFRDGQDHESVLSGAVQQVYHALVGALLTQDGRLLEETADWVGHLLDPDEFGPALVAELGRAMSTELTPFPLSAVLWHGHWPTATAAAT